MIFTLVLVTETKIYHFPMEYGKQVTIGSHKKDDIYCEQFLPEQITVKWKNNGIAVKTKEPYDYNVKSAPTDELMALSDENTYPYLFICSNTMVSDQTMEVPYNCRIKVGRSAVHNDIVIKQKFVSREHLVIRNDNGVIRVEDLNSTHGVFLNGTKVKNARMKSGDELEVLSVKIKLLNNILSFENVGESFEVKPVDSLVRIDEGHANSESRCLVYKRSPRKQDKLPYEDIVLSNAPSKGQGFAKRRGRGVMLASSAAMMGSSLLYGAMSPALIAARSASMIYPITSMASSRSSDKEQKKKVKDYEAKRLEKYGAYIEEQKAIIEQVAQVQRSILTTENPTPKECLQTVNVLSNNLWERMPSDRDFLHTRIGMGYEELCVKVKSRAESNGFQMESDEMRDLVDFIVEETRIVDNVPVRLPLADSNTVGIIGKRKETIALVKNMLMALCTAHCHNEVKIVGIFDKNEYRQWNALRWLPHIWDDDLCNRFLAFDKDEAHRVCESLKQIIQERKEDGNNKNTPLPHYIVLFGNKDMVEGEQIMNNLSELKSQIGISALFLFDEAYNLPHDCEKIIDLENGPCIFQRAEANIKTFFTPDPSCDETDFEFFARRMAAVELEGFAKKNRLPNSIDFLSGYGVRRVEQLNIWQRWSGADTTKSLKAEIGVFAGGEPFCLDISDRKHGPHGLVAGGTGSGKSELLVTMILALAVNYSPEDVNMILIDFKAGGMADRFDKLPHVVGKITNVDTDVSRSLKAIQAEIYRRLELFHSENVTDIEAYEKKYRAGQCSQKVPHLVIISDEYAELKAAAPTYMDDFVQGFRIGRSLGVHLVLATQRPNGVINDQINSNASYRLCLKVNTVADSREMLKRPDAALITQKGRCFIRVGEDDYFNRFQTFWAGAMYSEIENPNEFEPLAIVKTSGARRAAKHVNNGKTDSQLNAVIAHINDVFEMHEVARPRKLILPELKKRISLDKVWQQWRMEQANSEGEDFGLTTPLGVSDVPELQKQDILKIDLLKEGNYGVYGAASMGKSTFLRSIILSMSTNYSPMAVVFYLLDFGGWGLNVFANLPHVGGVVLDCEEEKLNKFEQLILEEIESRKKLFFRSGTASYNAYRKSGKGNIPAIVIVVDNIVSMFDTCPNLESLFVMLSSQGNNYGIYLVYTANSTNGVKYKMLGNIKNSITFQLADKGDYQNIVGRTERGLPDIPGRAYKRATPPILFQAAMYQPEISAAEQTAEIHKLIDEMNEYWQGERPKAIPVMPETVGLETLKEVYRDISRMPVGISYETMREVCQNFAESHSLLVTGYKNSGKSRMLQILARLLVEKEPQTQMYVFDTNAGELADISGNARFYARMTEEGTVDECFREITEVLQDRIKGTSNANPVCVVIEDIVRFVTDVSDDYVTRLERMLRYKGDIQLYVLVGGDFADVASLKERDSFVREVVSQQTGIATSGTPAQLSFFRTGLKATEKIVEAGKGNGFFFHNGECEKIKLAE